MKHKIGKHFSEWETIHFSKQMIGFEKCEIVSLN